MIPRVGPDRQAAGGQGDWRGRRPGGRLSSRSFPWDARTTSRTIPPHHTDVHEAGTMAGPQVSEMEIVAYSAWGFGVEIVPAWVKRDWMDATDYKFAYHCLPMTLANLSGWFVLAPHGA